MAVVAPKIKLYTNHLCPWAYRAHIALAELKIPYDEHIIDLYAPRPREYLDINPRGQVPTMIFDGTIITESAVVATFLADKYSKSNLWPASTDKNGPLARAKINFFTDAYFSNVQGFWDKLYEAKTDAAEKEAATAYVDAVVKEVEPLLTDANPFFGGSKTITLAEVLTGSWLLRVYTLTRHDVVPSSILDDLASRAPNFDQWAKRVIAHPSVLSVWDEDKIVSGTKGWITKLRSKV